MIHMILNIFDQFNLYIQRLIHTMVSPGHKCRDTHIRDFRVVHALVAAVPMAKLRAFSRHTVWFTCGS